MCSKFLQPQWWRAPVTSAELRHCSVSSAAVALHIREAGAILYLQGFSYNIKDKDLYKKAKINYANYMYVADTSKNMDRNVVSALLQM